MKYLGIEELELKRLGGIHTAREIQQQPDVWLKVYNLIQGKVPEIKAFMSRVLDKVDDIILTGAGTSAYIGECLVSDIKETKSRCVQAVATTDIVTHPQCFFCKTKKVLLVSFARSGDSPESTAAVDLAEKYSGKAYHLVITCNADGDLVKKHNQSFQYNIILPEETNDKSLAMTSSFSGMLLAGLLISRLSDIEDQRKSVEAIAGYGRNIFNNFLSEIERISNTDFKRVVFLGSGPLFGTALESHLKVQELSDGQIICKKETFLAFRHGPKAVINDRTIIVFLLSPQDDVFRYEKDLVLAIQREKRGMLLVGVSEYPLEELSFDVNITFSKEENQVDDVFLTICSVLPAQILGFFKSLQLGLQPDNPSVSGTISRVVEGVTIYN